MSRATYFYHNRRRSGWHAQRLGDGRGGLRDIRPEEKISRSTTPFEDSGRATLGRVELTLRTARYIVPNSQLLEDFDRMSTNAATLREEGFGQTQRRDTWWVQPMAM